MTERSSLREATERSSLRGALDFSGVPAIINEHGRAKGFERLRDLVLERPEAVSPDNLMGVLKLVIELDRHALFAAVSEAKLKDRMDQDAWEKFQEYLRGDDVTAAEKPAAKRRKTERSSLRSSLREAKEGKQRGKGNQKSERVPIREEEGVLQLLRGADPAGPGHEGPEGEHA